MWPEVLEQVKVKRRVSWMLLFDKVQVLGLDAGALTLGFPDAGSVKAFVASGHDEVLKQAVLDIVGAEWRIDAVHQPGGQATGSTPSTAPSAPLAPAAAAAPEPARPVARPKPKITPAAEPAADAVPDLPSDDDEDAQDAGVAGADLIARELGGRVIGEFDAS